MMNKKLINLLKGYHWDRVDDKRIRVYFSGYHPMESIKLAKKIVDNGEYSRPRAKFDNISGKTFMTFTKKSNKPLVGLSAKNPTSKKSTNVKAHSRKASKVKSHTRKLK